MIINDKRALAYTVQVDAITPIEGADNIALAHIGGWNVIVKKNEFEPGDIAVFFEIDSKLPEEPRYEFMKRKHYVVKTMKLGKFNVVSQGLLMPLGEFPELGIPDKTDGGVIDVGVDLTDTLHITYATAEDNKRKASAPNKNAKYQSMAARHQKIFRQKWARWMMRREWGKKVMFLIFGRKKDNPKYFPKHFEFVHPTDEERVENMPYILESDEPWVKTTKLDGTSTTFILERKKHKKLWDKDPYEFYVCSRNVRQLDPDQSCYHDSNVYWEMADKYNIKNKMIDMIDGTYCDYIAIQGETVGESVQGNPHKLTGRHFYAFNFITSDCGRWNSITARDYLTNYYNINWVPIVDTEYYLPKDMEEMKLSADGPCELEGATGPREGYVYRSMDGKRSFKNVSREYLLKHHG